MKSEKNVAITKSNAQSRCGSDSDYTVEDLTSRQLLGVFPVPRASEEKNDGRFLLVRAQQFLSTPKEQLIALRDATLTFYDDVDGLKEDLGIGAYVPNALPIENRTENNGRDYLVYVNIEQYCSDRYQESPSLVYRGLAIKTLEYIPGRTDYSPRSIYRQGDIKKAILSDTEILTEIQKRVESNAQHCRADIHGKREKWIEVSSRLKEMPAQRFQNAIQLFGAVKQRPTSAFMLNENRIAVEFVGGQKQFAGAIEEMVEIQTKLINQGIKVDKRGRLNWYGELTVKFAQEYNRPLPASLRD